MIKKKKTYYCLKVLMLGIALVMSCGIALAFSATQTKLTHYYSFENWTSTLIYDDTFNNFLFNGSARKNSTNCQVGYCAFYPVSGGALYSYNNTPYTYSYDSFTIAFWLKGYPSASDTALVRSKNVGYTGSFDVQRDGTSSLPALVMYNSSVGSGFRVTIGNRTIGTVASWYHLIIVYNGTHVYGYTNGTKSSATKVQLPAKFFKNVSGLRMGWGIGIANPMGIIDELYIFNRSISDTEASRLYNNNYSVQSFGLVNYAGYVTRTGVNYTRNLTYSLQYRCGTTTPTRIMFYVNNTRNRSQQLTCTNSVVSYSSFYNHPKEGNFRVAFILNASGNINGTAKGNKTYREDRNNPTITTSTINITSFFATTSATSAVIRLQCTESTFPTVRYRIVFNGAQVYAGNHTSATSITNSSSFIDGENVLRTSCGDPFGNTTRDYTFTAQQDVLVLREEKTGRRFQIQNLTSARVYIDGNVTYYDFKAANRSNITYTTLNNTRLRFELGYKDGSIITRYIDTALTTSPVYVCANNQTIPHYQQIIISGSEKVVAIKNSFSNCYIVYDKTRFAYQSGFFILAWSIDSMYNVYGRVGDTITQLSNLDGRVENTIYLDKLILEAQRVQQDIIGAGFSISKLKSGTTDTKKIVFSYINLLDEIDSMNITVVKRVTGEVVMTQDTFTNQSDWDINWDYSLVANLTNTTPLQAIVQYRTNGRLVTLVRDFTINLAFPKLESGVGFALAFLLLIFGLTLTKTSSTFGFFGFFIVVGAIVILSVSEVVWYVQLLLAVSFIILIYILFPLFYQNTAEVI